MHARALNCVYSFRHVKYAKSIYGSLCGRQTEVKVRVSVRVSLTLTFVLRAQANNIRSWCLLHKQNYINSLVFAHANTDIGMYITYQAGCCLSAPPVVSLRPLLVSFRSVLFCFASVRARGLHAGLHRRVWLLVFAATSVIYSL